MSTHSAIGIKHADGKITGCYVHYDGATMEPRIKDFISKKTTTGLFTLIVQGQKRGGIRGFRSPRGIVFHSPEYGDEEESESETDFLSDGNAYVIDETNFFDDHMGTFAWYLVDHKTGEIERTDKWS